MSNYGQNAPNPYGGTPNPYGSQSSNTPFGQAPTPNPYGQQPQNTPNPYGQQPQNTPNPYGQQPQNNSSPYGQQPQNTSNPYGQSAPRQTPFGQAPTPNPYGQQQPQNTPNPYGQQPQNTSSPYGQQPQNTSSPYGQPSPYGVQKNHAPSSLYENKPQPGYGDNPYATRAPVPPVQPHPVQQQRAPVQQHQNIYPSQPQHQRPPVQQQRAPVQQQQYHQPQQQRAPVPVYQPHPVQQQRAPVQQQQYRQPQQQQQPQVVYQTRRLFHIKALLNGMVLSVAGNSTLNGSLIITSPAQKGNKHQQWYWQNTCIMNAGSHLALRAQGEKVVIFQFQNSTDQKWALDGNCIKCEKDGKVLDIPRSLKSAGQRLMMHKKHGNLNQRFVIEYLDQGKMDTSHMKAMLQTNESLIAYDQPLVMKSVNKTSLRLHVTSVSENAPVTIWTQGANQKWMFSRDGYIYNGSDPSFVLECVPKNRGKVFISKKRFSASSNPVDNAIACQKFNVFQAGKAKYVASAYDPNLVLTVSGNTSYEKGDAVVMEYRNGHNANVQMWLFESSSSTSVFRPVAYGSRVFIIHKRTGSYTDVQSPLKAGYLVTAKKPNLISTANQNWIFEDSGFIASAKNSDFVLSFDPSPNVENKVISVQQRLMTDNLHQKWLVTRNTLQQGTVLIQSAMDPTKIISFRGRDRELFLDSIDYAKENSFTLRTRSSALI